MKKIISLLMIMLLVSCSSLKIDKYPNYERNYSKETKETIKKQLKKQKQIRKDQSKKPH